MRKRFIALMLVVLMIGQMLPLNALADGWNMAVSNEVQGADYVNVKFQYPLYTEEQGQESISGYELIVEQMVKKGGTAVEPNIPDLAGREFTGWVNSEGSPLDVKAPVNEDTVFTAAYRKLDIRTVTINYVFDVDGSMALEPYVAEFEVGSRVNMTIPSPSLSGFEPGEASVEVNIEALNEDWEHEVRYKGTPTSYTVRYHFQNAENNQYTDDGFYRAAVHDHEIDDSFNPDETGWIAVGPYTISKYPEGATIDGVDVSGQPVIAGGMTAVRDFAIEGFVQQDIVQRRVLPGGTTVVDVYYDREVHTYTVKNDGGTAVDSRTLRYGASLGLPKDSEMQRPGYVFDGFYSYGYKWDAASQSWVKDESNKDVKHDTTCKMPPYDFEIEVRWTPVEQAKYTVVYWVQSLSDKHDAKDAEKTYDFLTSVDKVGAVGEKPEISNINPSNHDLSNTFFTRNAGKSEIARVNVGSDLRPKYVWYAAEEIASDGSTVINVYFDRETVTFDFGHYQNRRWVTDYTRTGLYGQSWREAGYGENGWPGGRWSDEGGLGNGNWTYLDGFNHEDLTATSVRLERNTSDGRKDIYQYIEALDSTPENRKWIEADHYENGENNFNLSSKFLPGFTLYGYNTSTNNPTGSEIRKATSGQSVSYNSRLNVFSTRNSFTLSYANCEGMEDAVYKYEEKLVKPVDSEGHPIVPERPDNVEADNVFAGWYLDAAGQVPVDWGNVTMPAANMVAYAKWERPTFTVTYHDIRKDTLESGGVDTHDKHEFKVEKFGSLITSAGEEFETFDKSYVRDETTWKGNDNLTYIFRGWFLDEDYTVRWEPDTTISGDKDIYAYWEPEGDVYYRYVFIGMVGKDPETLGRWPEVAFDEKIWPSRPYGTTVTAAEDFLKAGLDGFPEFEGWRPASTLLTTKGILTQQYQEIPVYYTPTSTWPVTIHYVDENGKDILGADGQPFTEEHDLTEAKKVYEYRHIPNYKLTSEAQLTADRDAKREEDGRLHLYFHYEKINPLPYTVEYYQEQLDGTYAIVEDATVVYDAEKSCLKLGETAKIRPEDYKTFTGFTRNDNHEDAQTSVILQKDASQNVLKLYYDRNEYTVTYVYGDEVPDGAPELPEVKSYMYGAPVTVAGEPTCAGYTFNGWYGFKTGTPVSGTFDMPATNIRLQGNWMADTDTAYQVWFYFERSDGTYPTDPINKVTRGGTTDTEVNATDADKQDMTIEGLLYRFDADNANNVLSGTVAADGSLVLKLYFERVMADYTVHHYFKGTTEKFVPDENGSAQVGSSFKAKAQTRLDMPAFKEDSAVPQNATINISSDAAKNVVTIYYAATVNLKANDASKTYDGTPLTEGGFTIVNAADLGLSEEEYNPITLSMTADSSQTRPGTRPNKIDPNSIKVNGQAVPAYLKIELQEGELTVYNRLNVSKTITTPGTSVEGETGSALDVPTFSFKLTKGGAAVSGASYTVGSSNAATGSDGSFSLKEGEQATFTDLAPGSYTVREVVNSTSAWYPDAASGGSITTRDVTIGTSGTGDISVNFNNYRRSIDSITLRKVWIDGSGTAANRPDELTLKLVGKVGGSEVYSADVTLTAANNWQLKVSGLPAYHGGSSITYSLVEENVPEGYGEPAYSADGLTVTNEVKRELRTIQGVKTWVDGSKVHDNAKDITLTLQRRIKANTSWMPFNPGQDNFKWEGDTYKFTNLPSHDKDGYEYEYRVVEQVNLHGVQYEVTYSPADGIAAFVNAAAKVDITNTVHDENDFFVLGTKTWVDGDREHNNANEVKLTLTRTSAKQGAKPETVAAVPSWEGSTYTFSGLERYDDEGYAYTYEVEEAAMQDYTITYSGEKGYDITNTLTDLKNVEISGTKTWVDGGKQHNNADEVTLILTRTSAKQGAQPETVNVTPKWEGNTFTFSGLDRYDDEGYAYTYDVEEVEIDGYTTSREENTFNITNTIEQEYLTIKGTKTWVDDGESHGQIQVNVERKAGSGEWSGFEGSSITVDASTNWQYTFTNLPKYDENRNAYTYRVSEDVPAGYDVSYSYADGSQVADGIVFDQNNTATVNITNTLKTKEVTVYKYWEDTFNGTANYYGLRPSDVTIKFVSQPNFEGADTYTYEVKGDMWQSKDTSAWQAALTMRTHDEHGSALTYTVEEPKVPHYTRNKAYPLSITPSEQDIAQVYNELVVQDIMVQKVWDDAGWEDIRPEISFKLSNTDEKLGFDAITLPYDERMAFTVFGSVPASDSYVVEEIINTAGMQHSYTTSIVKSMEAPSTEPTEVPTEASSAEPTSEDGKTFTVTNKLNLQGGDGTLTVNKTWDDMLGSESDRPKVSFKLLYTDGTPVTVGENNEPYIIELGADNTAVFENLPASADGYIVQEVMDGNDWGYESQYANDRVKIDAGITEVGFANTRTIAEIKVNKTVVDETIDSDNGMASKFVFGVTVLNEDGTPAATEKKSEPIGSGESVTFNVPVGARFELKEYDANGNVLPYTWMHQGTGKYKADDASMDIDVLNVRMGGDITVRKAWLDGSGEPLADELIPESVEVQLYVGDAPVLDGTVLSGADKWTHTYKGMPAALTDGTLLDYEVKEIVDGTAYGDGDTVTIGEYDYEVSIDGFTITNTLKRGTPTRPEKDADDESKDGVQVGDTVTYTISRTSHLNTPTTATVTDALPKGLKYVGTTSVKVNGADATYDLAQDGSDIKWTIGNVPPMGKVEVVFTALVTKDALYDLTISNTAQVDLGDDSDTEFESEDERVPIANFTLEKTAALPEGKTKAEAGDTVEYTLTIKNTHTIPIESVIIEDDMFGRIDGDAYIVGGDILKVSDGKISISRILHTNESLTIKYSVVVTDEDAKLGYLDNAATAAATMENNDKIVRKDDTHTEVEQPEPPTPPTPAEGHITVTKQTVSTPKNEAGYALGETIKYLITVVNDGDFTITDIDVLDSLSDAEGKVIGRIDSLELGQSYELNFDYTVTEADILRGKVVNEATVNGTSPDPDEPEVPVTPGETEDDTEPKRGHITVTKQTVSTPKDEAGYALGETIEYLITVVNDGNLTVNDIDVLDSLSDAEGKVIGHIDSLAPGQSHELNFEYTVKASDILRGKVINEATISGVSPDPDTPDVPVTPGETEDKTEPERGHITVTKRTVSTPKSEAGYALGETIKYLITVINDGNVAITDIDVLDSLSSASGHVIGSIDRLEPGESREFSFEYTVKASDVLRGSVVNEATVNGTSPDPDEPDVPVTPGTTEDKTTPERKPKDDATFSIGAGYSAMNVFDCCE